MGNFWLDRALLPQRDSQYNQRLAGQDVSLVVRPKFGKHYPRRKCFGLLTCPYGDTTARNGLVGILKGRFIVYHYIYMYCQFVGSMQEVLKGMNPVNVNRNYVQESLNLFNKNGYR